MTAMDEFAGALRILALVTDNDALVEEARKALILYGTLPAGHKLGPLPDPRGDDALFADAKNAKRARLTDSP